MKYILTFLCLSLLLCGYSKKTYKYNVSSIAPSLYVNANSILRNEVVEVSIQDLDKMIIKHTRVTTVLNERGESDVKLSWRYEPTDKIKKINVRIYDRHGLLIKKLEPEDYRDVSSYNGSTTFHSDSRIIHANVNLPLPPFTVEVNYEVSTENTAFIPAFMPIRNFNQSLESANFSISWNKHMRLHFAEYNFAEVSTTGELYSAIYELKNMSAIEYEEYSSPLTQRTPYAKYALQEFYLAGQKGLAKDWNEIGKWIYTDLLKDGLKLPDSTVNYIENLVANEPEKMERAKLVYHFMQNRTRYINTQLGIGGWKPISAATVDKMGYGDCKALVNYTQALLAAADVPSQYVIVYGGKNKRDIDQNIPSIQGNHIILRIPDDEKPVWLECTSQSVPFAYLGAFTDDRQVLLIDSTGGVLARTPNIASTENVKRIVAQYSIDSVGGIQMKTSIAAKGLYYQAYKKAESLSARENRQFYDEQFQITLKGIEINNLHFSETDSTGFQHDLIIACESYAKEVGSKEFIFLLNPALDPVFLPEINENRITPIEIERSYTSSSDITFLYKSEYSLKLTKPDVHLKTAFGEFSLTAKETLNGDLNLTRTLTIYEGTYPKETYENFRVFFNQIAQADGFKALIKQVIQ